MRIKQTIGNTELWRREKTLFLTSRMAPLACYERVFQWVEEFDKCQCAVCFNTSEFEEEVLKALLVWRAPTTLVVLNKFSDRYNVQIEAALKENRLLILVLQPEEGDGKGLPARIRNQYVMGQVQHIACGYINKNGSIFGLLAGRSNVSYLLQDEKVSIAAEQNTKPDRWTVAEDKRLLRMFYEDMGIHAIHCAIDRPYSTIYTRIKSLTMNDEVLKGREFEDYVLELFNLPSNDKLTLKEWRGDKSLPGIYPESNSNPDLVFDYGGRAFAIECKWRNRMPSDINKDLLPPDRVALYGKYTKEHRLPVYLLLGIGGLPNDPDGLYCLQIREELSVTDILKGSVQPDSLLDYIISCFPNDGPQRANYRYQQKAEHPNAYAHWSNSDDSRLKQLYSEGKPVAELVEIFGRNCGSIKSRLRKLNLI